MALHESCVRFCDTGEGLRRAADRRRVVIHAVSDLYNRKMCASSCAGRHETGVGGSEMGQGKFSSVSIVAVLLSLTLVLQPFLTASGQQLSQSPRPSVPPLARLPIIGPTGVLPASGTVSSPTLPSSGLFRGKAGAHAARPKNPNGHGIFFNPATYGSGGVYADSVAVGDFNGDGKPDLVVANQCPQSNCNAGAVTVLLGNGDGTFQVGKTYPSGGYEAYFVVAGDVNGDG